MFRGAGRRREILKYIWVNIYIQQTTNDVLPNSFMKCNIKFAYVQGVTRKYGSASKSFSIRSSSSSLLREIVCDYGHGSINAIQLVAVSCWFVFVMFGKCKIVVLCTLVKSVWILTCVCCLCIIYKCVFLYPHTCIDPSSRIASWYNAFLINVQALFVSSSGVEGCCW